MIAGVFYPVEQVSILLRQDVHFKLLEDLSSLEMLQRPDQFKGNYFNNLFFLNTKTQHWQDCSSLTKLSPCTPLREF